MNTPIENEKELLLAQAQGFKNRYLLLVETALEKRKEATMAKKEAEENLALHLETMEQIELLSVA